MRLTLTESFQRDVDSLSTAQRDQIFSVILKLPKVVKDVHAHSGMGLRKLHSSGIFEARIGLGLRVVLAIESNQIILHRIGGHDEIRRYLKSL